MHLTKIYFKRLWFLTNTRKICSTHQMGISLCVIFFNFVTNRIGRQVFVALFLHTYLWTFLLYTNDAIKVIKEHRSCLQCCQFERNRETIIRLPVMG